METGTRPGRTARRRSEGTLRLLLLVVALLAGGALVGAPAFFGSGAPARASAQDDATPAAVGAATADDCPADLHGEGAEPWVRAELYFGVPGPDDDTAAADEEWQEFLDDEITPRFPAGLTVLTGYGQFQGSEDEEIGRQRSRVLIILYPMEGAAESSALLEEIRDEYEEQFDQQSVLRADAEPVCTSF